MRTWMKKEEDLWHGRTASSHQDFHWGSEMASIDCFSEHWSGGYDVCTNSFLYTMHNKLSTSCTCTCEQHFCALWSLFNCLLSLLQPSILIFWTVTPGLKLKCSTGELCSLKWNGTYFLQIEFVTKCAISTHTVCMMYMYVCFILWGLHLTNDTLFW